MAGLCLRARGIRSVSWLRGVDLGYIHRAPRGRTGELYTPSLSAGPREIAL